MKEGALKLIHPENTIYLFIDIFSKVARFELAKSTTIHQQCARIILQKQGGVQRNPYFFGMKILLSNRRYMQLI